MFPAFKAFVIYYSVEMVEIVETVEMVKMVKMVKMVEMVEMVKIVKMCAFRGNCGNYLSGIGLKVRFGHRGSGERQTSPPSDTTLIFYLFQLTEATRFMTISTFTCLYYVTFSHYSCTRVVVDNKVVVCILRKINTFQLLHIIHM